jgi:uroporphyrinogen decarboxylase
MRQAGRYLPEYRKVRDQAGSFLNLCFDPELAAEVTLQPLCRYDLDAAIVFSDILIVPHAMGLSLNFVEGEGPVLSPVRSLADVRSLLKKPEAEKLGSISRALARTKADLPPHVALIGFCGAPWTVATYMVEGKTSDRSFVLQVAKERQPWFIELIDRLVDTTVEYLKQQVAAGAEVLQIFDSWAAGLQGGMFDDYSLAPIQKIVACVTEAHPEIPVIVFARGVGSRHADVFRETGCAVIGVEQEQDLAALFKTLPAESVVQGNLDPAALLGAEDEMRRQILTLISQVPKNRHIFNLGHGINMHTPPEMVAAAIDAVRGFDGG